MRKVAFIPTREAKDRPIKSFLERAGWEVIYIIKNSIFDAYTSALKENDILAKDRVIMCHDDIEILMEPDMFNKIIDDSLTPKTGFLGIAGAKRLNKTACWWHGLGREYPHTESFLQGMVFHGSSINDCYPTYYGGFGEVEVLDGLFLVTTGATLYNINTKMPKDFVGKWDFYDIYYTYQAQLKGRKNKVVPIPVLHHSFGDGALKEDWDANRQAFIRKYGNKFIDIVLPHQSQLPEQA